MIITVIIIMPLAKVEPVFCCTLFLTTSCRCCLTVTPLLPNICPRLARHAQRGTTCQSFAVRIGTTGSFGENGRVWSTKDLKDIGQLKTFSEATAGHDLTKP